MTFQEKFDYLKEKYGNKVDLTKLTESFAAQIEMTDDDCKGIFYIAYINGNFAFEPYDYHDNTVAVAINSLLLEDCITGKADAVDCFINGKLFLTGNADHAKMIIEALKPVKPKRTRKTAPKAAKEEVKEAAEKKTTEKKATRKKSTKKEA